jgi:hypothetical protein
MKKKLFVIGAGILSIGILAGCEPMNLHFEGKQMNELRVEEILEDRLEDENGLDLEVDIFEEAE